MIPSINWRVAHGSHRLGGLLPPTSSGCLGFPPLPTLPAPPPVPRSPTPALGARRPAPGPWRPPPRADDAGSGARPPAQYLGNPLFISFMFIPCSPWIISSSTHKHYFSRLSCCIISFQRELLITLASSVVLFDHPS